jgi:hypothetical protein
MLYPFLLSQKFPIHVTYSTIFVTQKLVVLNYALYNRQTNAITEIFTLFHAVSANFHKCEIAQILVFGIIGGDNEIDFSLSLPIIPKMTNSFHIL